ncbi:MAG TPA: hypothetical protein VF708_05615 [Pyrinomonadaceae bacterium]|jgi:glycerol-3-phosphate dehydrogenase
MNDELAELKWFETSKNKLKEVFLKEGYNSQESEELGFQIAQGVRDVPRLISILENVENFSNDQIMDAIYDVLTNQFALEEAARVLIPKGEID